jgi:hypothetical protein
MNDLQKQLLEVTKRYTDTKKLLSAVERQYTALYARLYLDEKITSLKNEEIRKNTLVLKMENEHKDILDLLEDLRNKTREAYYLYGAIMAVLQNEEEKV